jgi:hypothetical protein
LKAQQALKLAHAEVKAGFIGLDAMNRGVVCDEPYQKLYRGLGVSVSHAAENIGNISSRFKLSFPEKQGAVNAARESLLFAGKKVSTLAEILAPTGSDPRSKAELQQSGSEVADAMKGLVIALKQAGITEIDNTDLLAAVKQLNLAMQGLVGCIDLPNIKGGKDALVFTDACGKIIEASTNILASSNNPQVVQEQSKIIEKCFQDIKKAIPKIADDQISERHMRDHLEKLGTNTRALMAIVPDVIANPTNQAFQTKLRNGNIPIIVSFNP